MKCKGTEASAFDLARHLVVRHGFYGDEAVASAPEVLSVCKSDAPPPRSTWHVSDVASFPVPALAVPSWLAA